MNPRWGGFSSEDYLEACLSAYEDEPQMEIETEVIAQGGDIDFRGFEIARSQFFDIKNRLSVRFSNEKFSFGKACLKKLENAEYVELLIHPLHQNSRMFL